MGVVHQSLVFSQAESRRGFAGLLVFIRTKPRSRHIPASVRRKKEAEFVLKTGKKFDRKKYELDPEVPFSSGGGHSEANLQVVEKGKKPLKERTISMVGLIRSMNDSL